MGSLSCERVRAECGGNSNTGKSAKDAAAAAVPDDARSAELLGKGSEFLPSSCELLLLATGTGGLSGRCHTELFPLFHCRKIIKIYGNFPGIFPTLQSRQREQNIISWLICMRVPHLWFVIFSRGILSYSQLQSTGACPVTTDLINAS